MEIGKLGTNEVEKMAFTVTNVNYFLLSKNISHHFCFVE